MCLGKHTIEEREGPLRLGGPFLLLERMVVDLGVRLDLYRGPFRESVVTLVLGEHDSASGACGALRKLRVGHGVQCCQEGGLRWRRD